MTNNSDTTAALRERLAQFDRETRGAGRGPRSRGRHRRPSPEVAAGYKAREAARIAAVRARPEDHPLGSIARPLPYIDPWAAGRAEARRNAARIAAALGRAESR